MTEFPEWAMITGNLGFPIVLAIYLLTRFEKKLDTLTKAINELDSENEFNKK
ncbi:YvrJ family protein [Halobacillus litoralis]|uniref:YvrJ family protein n=1 Tax=Halobacillus litoralis TaxID=45668 RepID=UPI00137143CE|nr:YvrJ family protein [Halobacillus litoralis]MYL39842.1 YvrJ family protein [Halobacillus litoralis]